MRITVRVPATSANLGPGFDCFGLALDLCNEVTLDTDAEPGVAWVGEGADELPTDGSDRVSRTMAAVAAAAGKDVPACLLRGTNRIPLERGLGSSAAATVAGVLLAGRLLGRARDPADDVSAAIGIEGHPDNAAAAVMGGLTIVAGDAAVRLAPHPGLAPAVLVPDDVRVPTERARRAIPAEVPTVDAVFNLQRVALAVVALTERPGYLSLALEDRLHQRRRLELAPGAAEMFELVRASGVPVCVSGAGPSLLAFELDGRSVPDPGPGWRVLRPGLRPQGAELVDG